MRYLMLFVLVLFLAGCHNNESRSELVAKRVKEYKEVSNVRILSGGYVLYDLFDGEVTCREHGKRSELACWRNF